MSTSAMALSLWKYVLCSAKFLPLCKLTLYNSFFFHLCTSVVMVVSGLVLPRLKLFIIIFSLCYCCILIGRGQGHFFSFFFLPQSDTNPDACVRKSTFSHKITVCCACLGWNTGLACALLGLSPQT